MGRTLFQASKKYVVTKGMRLHAEQVTAFLIDSGLGTVFYTRDDAISIPTRFLAVQSFHRTRPVTIQKMLRPENQQTYVTIGCPWERTQIDSFVLERAINLVSETLIEDSFAGLSHFYQKGVRSYFFTNGQLYFEPTAVDYGRLFEGTPHETIVRHTRSGDFDVLAQHGVWTFVCKNGVSEDIRDCWLIGRQERVPTDLGNNEALIHMSGNEHCWVDLLFTARGGHVCVTQTNDVYAGPGIFLGQRGQKSSTQHLINVERTLKETNAVVFPWISAGGM